MGRLVQILQFYIAMIITHKQTVGQMHLEYMILTPHILIFGGVMT